MAYPYSEGIFMIVILLTTFGLHLSLAASAELGGDSKLSAVAPGKTQAELVQLLGQPTDQTTSTRWTFTHKEGTLSVAWVQGKAEEIKLLFTKPRAIAEVLPTEANLTEQPRTKANDLIHPQRRLAQPSRGRIWLIGLSGLVEGWIQRAAWDEPATQSYTQLLSLTPPDEGARGLAKKASPQGGQQ